MYLYSFSRCFFIHTSTTQISTSSSMYLIVHRRFCLFHISAFSSSYFICVDLLVFFVCFFPRSSSVRQYTQVQRLLFVCPYVCVCMCWRSSIITNSAGVNTAICFVSWSTHISAHARHRSKSINQSSMYALSSYFHNKFSFDINIRTANTHKHQTHHTRTIPSLCMYNAQLCSVYCAIWIFQ